MIIIQIGEHKKNNLFELQDNFVTALVKEVKKNYYEGKNFDQAQKSFELEYEAFLDFCSIVPNVNQEKRIEQSSRMTRKTNKQTKQTDKQTKKKSKDTEEEVEEDEQWSDSEDESNEEWNDTEDEELEKKKQKKGRKKKIK